MWYNRYTNPELLLGLAYFFGDSMKFRIMLSLLLLVLCGSGVLLGCDQPNPEEGIHSHRVTAWQTVKAPTCTEEGSTTATCVECGEVLSGRLEKIAHQYEKTVVAPTCTEAGYTEYACGCGETYVTNWVSSAGHTFNPSKKAPTCETAGYTRFVCSCGYAYNGEPAAPLGHTLVKTVVAPTCETAGYTTYTCDCGYTYDTDHIAPLGHTLAETVIPPTCDRSGYTRLACDCGYGYDTDHVEPLGHALIETVILEPTCEEEGAMEYACERCDVTLPGASIPPLAHLHTRISFYYPTISRDGYVLHTCLDCGTQERTPLLYEDIVTGAYVENTTALKQGIDTSKWNHVGTTESGELKPLDWAALKAAGVEFAILKAGSTKSRDSVFERDYLDAKAAGLEVGAYFYTYATTVEEALQDAEMLLTWLEGKKFEFPIYLDMEDPSISGLGRELLTDICKTFVERLQEEGYYAALYVNNEWLHQLLDTDWVKENLDVWYARYPADGQLEEGAGFTLADDSFVWKDGGNGAGEDSGLRYGLWQYTSHGMIEGFTTYYDFNYAYKDYASIMAQWGLNGF